MEVLPYRTDLPTVRLAALHGEHDRLFKEGFEILKNPSSSTARKIDREVKERRGEMIQLLKKISNDARQEQNEKSRMTLSITNSTVRVTAGLCISGILLGILVAITITRSISGAIHQLKRSTEEIPGEQFNNLSPVGNHDEIGDLSQAFQLLVNRLKRLEEMYLDASPLTRLPGGIAIENVLKKRLESSQPIAFCVLDLDNFKAFNDRYGYANGSEVIKETARIIENSVKAKGSPDDFIGHVGGDDFVVITNPDFMREISTEVISQFDRRIPDFYDPAERARGYILGKTRQGIEMQFPIMTISIAIVTNERRKLTNPLEASEIAAELKDYAKTINKSVFVVDKRRGA